jgi:hypothetical protein
MTLEPASIWDGLPPLRLRVLVKGASTAVWVEPPGGARTNQTYAWWLEVLLEKAGFPSDVRNAGREAQKITKALCDWEDDIQQFSPDVVILNYGIYECMPGMLPRWLERHAVGWHHHSTPIRDSYRAKFLAPTWRRLVTYQQALDSRLDRGPFRTSPQRFIAEMQRLVEMIRVVGSPLVLVMDPSPVSSRWQKWFPGMSDRLDALRVDLVKWLGGLGDPNVRLFGLSEIVFRHDLEEVLPDGAHFTASLHREIAQELANEIAAWAADQPHLKRT